MEHSVELQLLDVSADHDLGLAGGDILLLGRLKQKTYKSLFG